MNNSKTNKEKKMRFAPNRRKRSRVLCGNEKKNSFVGDQQMALSDFLCKATNDRYKNEQLQQVMIIEAYMHRNAPIVEKALLVKVYYKNSESAIAALPAYRYMYER